MQRRVIFHIDVNSAFVSWSAVKILSEGGQDIRLVPSVVSGDPSDRRSIVAAKSIPCKRFGINTAEPVSMAIRKCPQLVIVRGDWEWYKKCSMNFIAICRTYSPILQQFSVDECFAACEVAHRIRRDEFYASGVSVFVKTKDFEVHSKQYSLSQPTDVTALLLNEARRLIPIVWDGVTPLRQVGFGVFKLTHEAGLQLSLFEDEKIEYYRQWDRDYDAKLELRESDSRHRQRGKEKALVFSYHTGEEALAAAKKSVRSGRSLFFSRTPLEDGTDCFSVMDADGKILEKHTVLKLLK